MSLCATQFTGRKTCCGGVCVFVRPCAPHNLSRKKPVPGKERAFLMEILTDVHFVRVSAFAAVFVQPVDLVHVLFA